MLSDLQRKRVWEAWLSAEIRANYFADLAGRYHRQQRWTTWLTLFTSSGAVAAFVTRVPHEWVAPGLALLAAALSLYAVVSQNQQRALDSSDLHFRWNRLASAYRGLWDNMYAEDAPAQLAKLDDEAAAASRTGSTFPVSERRLRKWQRYVVQHHAPRSAAA
jgi:hypothetical protein